MSPESLLVRTQKGREEIDERRHHLAPALRHVLILIDGATRLADLAVKGERIPNFRESLDALIAQGFVTEDGAVAAGGTPKARLIDAAHRLLGKNAGKVVSKLEESADAIDSLKVTVESAAKLIRLTIDEGKAVEFAEAAKAILGR